MKRILVVLVILCASTCAWSQEKRGPSTPEERAKVIQIAKALENDPVAATLYPERQWLVKFVMDVPDISITLCGPSFPYEKKFKFSSDLLALSMGAMPDYVIEHPDSANDTATVGFVGAEAVLRGYTKLLETHPKDHSKKLDEWLGYQKDGTLAERFKKDWNEGCKPQAK